MRIKLSDTISYLSIIGKHKNYKDKLLHTTIKLTNLKCKPDALKGYYLFDKQVYTLW